MNKTQIAEKRYREKLKEERYQIKYLRAKKTKLKT